jgi:hypothetical protein
MSFSAEDKKKLAELQSDMIVEMDSTMKALSDKDFVSLLDTVSRIESGPARILLLEAAVRLARKIGN